MLIIYRQHTFKGTDVITRALADFAANLRYEDLPPATAQTAKCQLLDGLGCLIAGTAAVPGRCAAQMVQRLGGEPQATVFVESRRNSVCNAAFANGVTLYSVGLNDFLQRAGAHPGACVIPVLLAIGEWQRAPGARLIAAMAAGYEIIDRLGRAIMPSHRLRGFHPTGTCGTFGATAAAGRLLGFTGEQLACAFGIAGSQAAGLYEYINDGTMTIMFHAGRAAKNGVEAALLTQAGMTGPATVFEGTRGFFRATADVVDTDAALRDLTKRWALNETTSRPYFGCTSTIAASGATAQIVRSLGGRVRDIRDITVICNPVVVRDNADTDPRTLLAARLSLAFNVALVVARGDVQVVDLADKDLQDQGIRELMPLVHMSGDERIPRFGATVQIALADGSRHEVAMHSWRGDSDDPLPWEEVAIKFRRLVAPVSDSTATEAVIDQVAHIENSGAMQLVDVLRAAVARKKYAIRAEVPK